MGGQQVGTTQGDKIIAEAEEDPEFQGFGNVRQAINDNDDDSEDEKDKIMKKARHLSDIFG